MQVHFDSYCGHEMYVSVCNLTKYCATEGSLIIALENGLERKKTTICSALGTCMAQQPNRLDILTLDVCLDLPNDAFVSLTSNFSWSGIIIPCSLKIFLS